MTNEKLGERIRRVRKQRGLGLREAATQLAISATYLSRIETLEEKSPPGEELLRRMAKLLDDDFDDLMRLAGRVATDVEDVITGDPAMPEFLRQVRARNLSADDLLKMLNSAKKKGGK